MGAVVDGGPPQLVLNEDLVRQLAPSPNDIRSAMARELAEIGRQRRLYQGDRLPPAIAGRTLIVVDDGIATGATARAALRGLRKAGLAAIILATPVAPAATIAALGGDCDELVCLRRLIHFMRSASIITISPRQATPG